MGRISHGGLDNSAGEMFRAILMATNKIPLFFYTKLVALVSYLQNDRPNGVIIGTA
jgi:hypothetical protein